MIAETYSTVGRSLPLTWLNVWEKYGERLGGERGEEGFRMDVLLQQQPWEAGLSSSQKVYELYLCWANHPDCPSGASQMARKQQLGPSASRKVFAGTHESSAVLGVRRWFS
jgi:hypothetical protein